MDKPRTVDAYRHGSQLWINCPYCGAIHFHGPPAGHRSAHCPDGRTRDGERAPTQGYVLREVGERKPPPPSRRPRAWAPGFVDAYESEETMAMLFGRSRDPEDDDL